MQLLPSLAADAKAAAREAPAGRHLPFAKHVDAHTIETRDGLLMQVIGLRGLLFETADTDEISYRKRLRDAMFQAIGDPRFAFLHHVVRRPIVARLDAEYGDRFSRRLDEMWQSRLAGRKLYANDLYLTIIRRPLEGRVGLLGGLRDAIFGSNRIGPSLAHEIRQLDIARDALMAGMGIYEPRLLGVYESITGPCSEPLEFFSTLYNGDVRPILLPKEDLGHYLPARRISFGQETIELARFVGGPSEFVGISSVKDYPAQSYAGMFDELMRLPYPLTITQSFGFVERRSALGRMNLALRRMRSAEDEALSLRDELSVAKDNVAAGRSGFGEHHMTVSVRADTPAAVDGAIAEVQAVIADLGAIAVREDIGLEPAFWAQFPGNLKLRFA